MHTRRIRDWKHGRVAEECGSEPYWSKWYRTNRLTSWLQPEGGLREEARASAAREDGSSIEKSPTVAAMDAWSECYGKIWSIYAAPPTLRELYWDD
jgi:hypothetical protein